MLLHRFFRVAGFTLLVLSAAVVTALASPTKDGDKDEKGWSGGIFNNMKERSQAMSNWLGGAGHQALGSLQQHRQAAEAQWNEKTDKLRTWWRGPLDRQLLQDLSIQAGNLLFCFDSRQKDSNHRLSPELLRRIKQDVSTIQPGRIEHRIVLRSISFALAILQSLDNRAQGASGQNSGKLGWGRSYPYDRAEALLRLNIVLYMRVTANTALGKNAWWGLATGLPKQLVLITAAMFRKSVVVSGTSFQGTPSVKGDERELTGLEKQTIWETSRHLHQPLRTEPYPTSDNRLLNCVEYLTGKKSSRFVELVDKDRDEGNGLFKSTS